MTEQDGKKTLSLSGKGTLGLSSSAAAKVRQNLTTGGRSGSGIAVEVKRKRSVGTDSKSPATSAEDMRNLTSEEREARARVLQDAIEEDKRRAEEAKKLADLQASMAPADSAETTSKTSAPAEEKKELSQRERELEELRRIEEEERLKNADRDKQQQENLAKQKTFASPVRRTAEEEENAREELRKAAARKGNDKRRDGSRLTVAQALNYEYEIETKAQSLAAQKRARQKHKKQMNQQEDRVKQYRTVKIPDVITVQELANRMTERGADVIKFLMQNNIMATLTQSIDGDTAELVVTEFGHTPQRVSDSDIETGIMGDDSNDENMLPRPPVVTIMGHVDHGKTSILDALRKTDVVGGEAGGITQHIGAYQVTLKNGGKISFLDTPGHAAFTEMRSRGANVTDIVVLVIAANDSVMPQTIEAINHAKAANVPIIVAINKCDLPDANPQKVKQELLQHEVILEDFSGDVLSVEVSAKTGTGLDKLEEIILLQAEILDLRANPARSAVGTVVEAKLDKGRGSVATVLVQKGTLRVGDTFVTGSEWGRIRAMADDKGRSLTEALPSLPVEVLGLSGTPSAGDDFVVVDSEKKAREIAAYRDRKKKEALNVIRAEGSTMENLFAQAKAATTTKTLNVILKGDVHGSVEAIAGSLTKLSKESDAEVEIKVIHSGVGEITDADITLANASNALLIGFNVRANTSAREMAKRDGREIRYYSIIYNILDDVKALLGGMLSPTIRENFIGYAQIRQIFVVTKSGKVAGCMVTDGIVKRGAKVRLLRDNVVIHEGMLKTLRRFKDEVKEAREGMECGMAFENYDDIKEGDVIEAFELIEEKREIL